MQNLPPVSNLFQEVKRNYKLKFRQLFTVSLIIFAVGTIYQFFIPQTSVGQRPELSGMFFVMTVVITIVGLMCEIAFVYVASGDTASTALKKAPRKIWTYFWTSLIAGITVALGFVLLIVPGILFALWYSQTLMVVILEDLGGFKAMKRSKEYVKGYSFEVFVRWLLIMLMAVIIYIPSMILDSSSPLVSNLYSGVVSLFLSPFITLFMYQIYKDLKALKETPEVSNLLASETPQTNG